MLGVLIKHTSAVHQESRQHQETHMLNARCSKTFHHRKAAAPFIATLFHYCSWPKKRHLYHAHQPVKVAQCTSQLQAKAFFQKYAAFVA